MVLREEFKQYAADAKPLIRIGEGKPYSNVILRRGVPFSTSSSASGLGTLSPERGRSLRPP
jgi:hypothetical protein